MRRSQLKYLSYFALGLVSAGLTWGTAGFAHADDESEQVTFKIRAPLDAFACDTTPPTVTVLGLPIDITTAVLTVDDDMGKEDKTTTKDGSSSGAPIVCTDLVTGQSVEVLLVGDTPPLQARAVKVTGGDESESKVKAPVQSVDADAKTITLLGLTIDASQAELDGADDEDTDGDGTPIDLSQIVAGQFAEVDLGNSAPPNLVAGEIEVKNFTNQVEVELIDNDGSEVEDMDDQGHAVNDVQVTVTEKVFVKVPAGIKSKATTRRVRQTVTLQTNSNGSFSLAGLPPGRAKVSVKRTTDAGTQTARRMVTVVANQTQPTKMRLSKPR